MGDKRSWVDDDGFEVVDPFRDYSKEALERDKSRLHKLSKDAPATIKDNPTTSLESLSSDELVRSDQTEIPVDTHNSLDLEIAALKAEQTKKEE